MVLDPDDVYFAMPLEDGQLESGGFRGGIVVTRPVEKDEGLFESQTSFFRN